MDQAPCRGALQDPASVQASLVLEAQGLEYAEQVSP
jgi:hypothetical protein